VKIGTVVGEYPFVFRRVERRPDGVAIVGTVAGIESSVLLEREDAVGLARRLALPLAAVGALVAYRRARR
jgi:hypothetical protein